MSGFSFFVSCIEINSPEFMFYIANCLCLQLFLYYLPSFVADCSHFFGSLKFGSVFIKLLKSFNTCNDNSFFFFILLIFSVNDHQAIIGIFICRIFINYPDLFSDEKKEVARKQCYRFKGDEYAVYHITIAV